MRYLSFDIEISDVFELKPGEDLDDHGPLHISVAATVDSEGARRLWYSTAADGKPAARMDQETAAGLLEFLEQMQRDGCMLFAWNGLSFDLRWIGHNAGDMERAARVALGLYDPMFQFFCRRGFPVSLASVAEAMRVGQSKLMDSADAPREWQKVNHQRVMDYVVGDCQMTNRIVDAIHQQKRIAWKTRKGTVSSESIPRFKTVAEALRDPLPDVSWMTGGGLSRTRFAGWLPASVLPKPLAG